MERTCLRFNTRVCATCSGAVDKGREDAPGPDFVTRDQSRAHLRVSFFGRAQAGRSALPQHHRVLARPSRDTPAPVDIDTPAVSRMHVRGGDARAQRRAVNTLRFVRGACNVRYLLTAGDERRWFQ
eukprot:219891-Pyramimonas_sp.AAC.1